MPSRTSDLYYEAHITFEPVFDDELELARAVGLVYGFRVAELLMKKRLKDTPTRSAYDTFCTMRHKDYDTIEDRTLNCVKALQNCGIEVWRYKIEDTLLDVRL